MWWICLFNMFTHWILYWCFLGMEHLTRGSLVSNLVVMTTMIPSPLKFLNRLGTLSPGVPLISVNGTLTITGMWGSALIIYRWLFIGCLGAFPSFLSDISKFSITRQFLHFDGVHNALAINVEALSLIPHFLQHFLSNSCSMSLKRNASIIIRSAWN